MFTLPDGTKAPWPDGAELSYKHPYWWDKEYREKWDKEHGMICSNCGKWTPIEISIIDMKPHCLKCGDVLSFDDEYSGEPNSAVEGDEVDQSDSN